MLSEVRLTWPLNSNSNVKTGVRSVPILSPGYSGDNKTQRDMRDNNSDISSHHDLLATLTMRAYSSTIMGSRLSSH